MNFNEYQDLSKRTMPYFDGKKETFMKNITNYALGFVGEAAEASDEIKKVVFHGHIMNVEKVTKEIGDNLHYAAGLCSLLGVKLEDVAKQNIEKLQGKGGRYEHGFSHEASRNR